MLLLVSGNLGEGVDFVDYISPLGRNFSNRFGGGDGNWPYWNEIERKA